MYNEDEVEETLIKHKMLHDIVCTMEQSGTDLNNIGIQLTYNV